MITAFFEDLRYAGRGLRRDPLLALVATLTLAICIAANTTVFSVVDSILIRPLAYPDSQRIDWISERSGPAQQDVGVAPDYFAIRAQNGIFEDVAAFSPSTVNWTGVDRPEQLDASSVSASFFNVMGTKPLIGRYFNVDEEGPKAPAVAVVSFAFWRTRLGSDPSIVGKSIGLDRLTRTIVGVMPQGFDFPRGAQIWLPSTLDKASQSFPLSPRSPLYVVSILARRRPGITPQQGDAEMSRLTFMIRNEYKVFQATGFRSDLTIAAVPLQRHLTGQARPALLVLTSAVGLVLLIACVNLANLMLARAGSRRRELAVRLALGSTRGRVIRQMLAESLALALPGGVAGIAIAWIAVRVLDAAKPAILVRYPAISMDMRGARVHGPADSGNQFALRHGARAVCRAHRDPGGFEAIRIRAQRRPARYPAAQVAGGCGTWRIVSLVDRRRVAGAQLRATRARPVRIQSGSLAYVSRESDWPV